MLFRRKYLVWILALSIFALSTVVEPGYPSLWDSKDATLQKELEEALNAEFEDKFWNAFDQQKICIALVDITDKRRPKVAEINGDVMMYAASLPKIAILLGVFVEIEKGSITLDDELRTSLVNMIRYSSNLDATRNLHRVGFEKLADILQSKRYQLYDPDHNGGLWIGQDYGEAHEWKRDPLHQISHGATAMQVARYYYLAVTDRLVAPDYSSEFWEILSDSAIDSKFVKGLKEVNPDAEIYRKSGTWRNFHADSGVVVDSNYHYIIVAIARLPQGAETLVRLIDVAEKTIRHRHEKKMPTSNDGL